MAHTFKVGKVEIGGGDLFFIGGPCVIESEKHVLKMAECVAGVSKALHLPFIFKASYDKANRTSLKSFRGIGMEAGLRALAKVKLLAYHMPCCPTSTKQGTCLASPKSPTSCRYRRCSAARRICWSPRQRAAAR